MGKRKDGADRRRAGAWVVSTLAHALVIIALARTVDWRFAAEPAATPPIQLALVASPEPPRVASVNAPTAPWRAAAPALRRLEASGPTSATAVVLPSAPSASAPAETSSVDGRADADLRGALRATLGCALLRDLHPTDDEKKRCERHSVDAMRAAPQVDGLAPEKRKYYDAVVEAYADRRAPAPTPELAALGGRGPGNQHLPLDSTGPEAERGTPVSHLPGFGCSIPFGIPKGWKPPKHGPPHWVRLGPLPCGFGPPKGFLTEEADLPHPADLEREAP